MVSLHCSLFKEAADYNVLILKQLRQCSVTLRYFKYQFSASVQSKRWITQRLIVFHAAAAVLGSCSESNINCGS